MRNYKIDIKKNNFPEVLGSRKMQNQKNFEKTKKKQKNNFPEVLEMEEVRQETQNIVFFVFLVFPRFFDFSLRGPPQRVSKYCFFCFFGFSKVF